MERQKTVDLRVRGGPTWMKRRRHTGEARKDWGGATGKGRGPRGYPSVGRNERAVRTHSNGETAAAPQLTGCHYKDLWEWEYVNARMEISV